MLQGTPLHPRPAEETPQMWVPVGAVEGTGRQEPVRAARLRRAGSWEAGSGGQRADSTALAPGRIEPFVFNRPDLTY